MSAALTAAPQPLGHGQGQPYAGLAPPAPPVPAAPQGPAFPSLLSRQPAAAAPLPCRDCPRTAARGRRGRSGGAAAAAASLCVLRRPEDGGRRGTPAQRLPPRPPRAPWGSQHRRRGSRRLRHCSPAPGGAVPTAAARRPARCHGGAAPPPRGRRSRRAGFD